MLRKKYLLTGLFLSNLSLYAQQQVVADYLGRFDGQLAPVMINRQKQWLHLSGAVLVDKLENQGYFKTIIAVKHNAYGAISNSGKIIAPFKYDEVILADEKDDTDSSKNYCFVITRLNGKYGAADTLGNEICPPVYTQAEPMTPHVLKMKKDGRWGWIDIKTGKVLQAPLYEDAGKSYVRNYTIEIKKAGKVGLAAEDGTIIVPAEYESFNYLSSNNTYFGFTSKGKSGVMDHDGRIVVPAVYDKCSLGPGNDLFAVTQNGKTGVVDAHGQTLLPLQYTEASLMGTVMKVGKGGKYGVVNAAGKEIIPPLYSDIKAVNAEGREVYDAPAVMAPGGKGIPVLAIPLVFLVSKGTATGIFDTSGKQLLPFAYSRITPFLRENTLYLEAEQQGKTGLLGIDGKIIVPLVYDGLVNGYNSSFSYLDDLAGEDKKNYQAFLKGEQLGLFNTATGKEILPAKYSWMQWQNNQLLFLRNGDTTSLADATGKIIRGGKQYGFFTAVDTNRIVETQYNNDGTTTCTLSDIAGNVLYSSNRWEFKEDRVTRLLMPESSKKRNAQFSNGLLKVWGSYSSSRSNLFLDTNGKEVVFDDYSFVGDFWNGLALAGKDISPNQTLYGIINRNKEVIYPITADDINTLEDLLLVKKGDLKGLITREGKVLLPVEYSEISSLYGAPFFKIGRNRKYGITDTLGRMILPVEFDDISYREDNKLFEVTREGKKGIAGINGKMIIPAIYDEMEINQGYERNIFPLLVKQGEWYFYLDAQGKPFPYKSKKKKGYDD
ncbi:WG repeat-containing protein [Chitinophaga polysaccharea]|uniref:WG repeat-containing protein n=1 Tax=Chitinophaga polysaccharea TaxID=1293035 RepID=UPI00115912DF|nr:WG repeat-containing protein [Chitinophaga polysaccharea]